MSLVGNGGRISFQRGVKCAHDSLSNVVEAVRDVGLVSALVDRLRVVRVGV